MKTTVEPSSLCNSYTLYGFNNRVAVSVCISPAKTARKFTLFTIIGAGTLWHIRILLFQLSRYNSGKLLARLPAFETLYVLKWIIAHNCTPHRHAPLPLTLSFITYLQILSYHCVIYISLQAIKEISDTWGSQVNAWPKLHLASLIRVLFEVFISDLGVYLSDCLVVFLSTDRVNIRATRPSDILTLLPGVFFVSRICAPKSDSLPPAINPWMNERQAAGNQRGPLANWLPPAALK